MGNHANHNGGNMSKAFEIVIIVTVGMLIGAWWSDAKYQCRLADFAGREAVTISDLRQGVIK